MEVASAERAVRHLRAALDGRYEIEGELGRGGMATVYLARDLRHRRRVALKVLHPELSAVLGPERFLKEIEVTAGLQHPHILPLFDSGTTGGQLWYVMPYVEGETLRDRLERERQLPVGEALRLARQVADALAYAHARGVVHRDVKPENILLQGATPGAEGGNAVVSDFGIALAFEHAGGARMTHTGLSLGTPQYMAPEQAMGERTIDARADVYALGVVTYEMLAGEPPFTGATVRAIVARLVSETPRSLIAQRPSVPPHVEAAVLTALERLPADRFPGAAAFGAALAQQDGAAPRTGPGAEATARGVRSARRRPAAALAALAAGALATSAIAAAGWWWVGARAPAVAPPGAVRFVVEPDSATLRPSVPALSPDGRTLVYAAGTAEGARLYARRLDDVEAHPIAGTDDGREPFFSPDGAWLAFVSGGAIRKVRLSGGPVSLVTDLPDGAPLIIASWAPDGNVYYTAGDFALFRAPSDGGRSERMVIGDSATQVGSVAALPDGRHLLVSSFSPLDTTGPHLSVFDLRSNVLRRIGPGGLAAQYAAGHVLYFTLDLVLRRRPFDPGRLTFTGPAEALARDVRWDVAPAFAASRTGDIVYGVGLPQAMASARLVLADRAGREQRALPARAPWAPRFSPDGRRIAYGARAPGRDDSDVWVTDLEAGTTRRVSTEGRDNNDPSWSPDGRSLTYSSYAGPYAKRLVVRSADGGPPRLLPGDPKNYDVWPSDWSRDGGAVLYTRAGLAAAFDVWVQPVDGGAARPYLATPARETGARVSPDGRWVAYVSNESGRDEVYVESFPSPGRRVLVSAGGGTAPVWRADGRELYHWREDQLVAVTVASGADGALAVGGRTPLFRAPYLEGVHANYDVSADGTRFVLVSGRRWSNRLIVVLNALGGGTREGRR